MVSDHTCATTSKTRGSMANKAWIADRGKELLRKDPSVGAKKLQQRLQDEHRNHSNTDKEINMF